MSVAWVTLFECSDETFIVGFFETEYAAYMEGIITESNNMNETYYLVRKYEEPSDYFKCITRLGMVDWTNETEREKWKEQHIESREQILDYKPGKPRFKVWKTEASDWMKVKKEKDVMDGWMFEPVE